MKVFLMYPDRNLNPDLEMPWNENVLVEDLELTRIFKKMAGGDKFLHEIVKKVMLNSESDVGTILHRQAVLKDCIRNSADVRKIYDILVRSITEEKKQYFWFSQTNPELILHESIKVMQIFINSFGELRKISDSKSTEFESEGFKSLFSLIKNELDDAYLSQIGDILKTLSFPRGVPVSVELGRGNEGVNYNLLKLVEKKTIFSGLISQGSEKRYTFTLGDRDESGSQAIVEMRNRGIINITNVLKESAENVLGFFYLLRNELAFYIGCLNLYDYITGKGEPVCFPVPVDGGGNILSFNGVYDISLSLGISERVVGNDMNADGKDLVIITGANRGGKSTFLRSIGQTILMMQCGMFVPAVSFTSDLRRGLFTHFKKEEDRGMTMGKLDEELSRMNSIVDHLKTGSLILFNESFSATNTREGSQISSNIVDALIEKGIKVFFVSHLYEFSINYYERRREEVLFLRAERKTDGTHTYRIIEGNPLETSHSEDLFNKIFGDARDDAPAGGLSEKFEKT